MAVLLEAERECHCRLCAGRDDQDQDRTGHCGPDNTAELVTEHGWSATAVESSDDVPAWAYTIGLWHSLGSPEVAMFGLRGPDMQRWINVIGRQIRDGRPLDPQRQLDGVLPGGFPLVVQPVHPGWYPFYFGAAMRFYRHRPPLPIVQVVWPDRDGRFPWDDGAGANCRANQPRLWLAPDEHPPGLWRDLEAITPWPFPDTGVRAEVFTTTRIVEARQPVRGVVRGHDGHWEFLDGLDVTEQTIAVVHLHHLYARHPHLAPFAALAPGRQAWLAPDGTWAESGLPAEQ
jgi:hypothetical protein